MDEDETPAGSDAAGPIDGSAPEPGADAVESESFNPEDPEDLLNNEA